MGTTFVVMTALKLCVMGGTGMAIATAFQYFHNFDYKAGKKKGGDSDVSKIGESMRERSRSLL